jgi:uncharacterized membrane protein
LRDHDFELINHRGLTTIYPPLAQGLFALGSAIERGVVPLKSIFTVFDVGIMAVLILLLRARARPALHVLIYAWNPLVIVESTHSGHLDAAGAFFLISGLALLASGRRLWAGVVLGASALVKYLALALTPFLLRRRYWPVLAAMIVTVVLGFAPFRDAGAGLFRTLGTYGFAWSFNGPPFMTLSVLLGDCDRRYSPS